MERETKMGNTEQAKVGDFISVPAWDAYGQVIAVEPAWYGSNEARRVSLQERPESAGRWYTLEPNDFEIEN